MNPSPVYENTPRYTALYRTDNLPTDQLVGMCVRVVRVFQDPLRESGYRVMFRDLGGEQFITRPIHSQSLIASAQQFLKQGQLSVAYGYFPSVEKGEPGYDGPGKRFDLIDLRRSTKHTSLLEATPEELSRVDVILEALLKEPGGLQRFLTMEARRILGVDPTYISARYALVEEACILQALSIGQVLPSLNSRLSMFLIGGPGSAKTLLGRYSLLFAPIGEQVQATLATAPGLSARVEMTQNGWQAEPGILPLCTSGACVIDDLHRADEKQRALIEAILMPALEEGRVKPTKAAQASYESRCAIVITSNRLSLKNSRKKTKKLTDVQERAADLVLPFDLLSRIDLVINMGAGDDALRSAMKIASQEANDEFRQDENEDFASGDTPLATVQEMRLLKLLVARVKDRFATVDMSRVGDKIEKLVGKIGILLREYTSKLVDVDEDSFDGDALVRRCSNSMRKLVGSLARMDGRSYATNKDLKRAAEILTPKLEVVRFVASADDKIRTLPGIKQQFTEVLKTSEDRWCKILRTFGGSDVRLSTIAEALSCSQKTVARELKKRHLEPDQSGFFQIPLESTYAPPTTERKPPPIPTIVYHNGPIDPMGHPLFHPTFDLADLDDDDDGEDDKTVDFCVDILAPPTDPDCMVNEADLPQTPVIVFPANDGLPIPPKEIAEMTAQMDGASGSWVVAFYGGLIMGIFHEDWNLRRSMFHSASFELLDYVKNQLGMEFDFREYLDRFLRYLLEPTEFIERAKRAFALMSLAGDRKYARYITSLGRPMNTWSDELKEAYEALEKRFDISEAAWNAFFKEKEKRERRVVSVPPVYQALSV